MTTHKSFPPALLDIQHEGPDTIEYLYELFRRDFVASMPTYSGLLVEIDDRIVRGCRPNSFWKLTHYAYTSGGAGELFDVDRAKRMLWVRAVIEAADEDDRIIQFDYKEGNGSIRRYLWFKLGDFAVVLQRATSRRTRKPVYRLITAFYMDFHHKRQDMERKYLNRE